MNIDLLIGIFALVVALCIMIALPAIPYQQALNDLKRAREYINELIDEREARVMHGFDPDNPELEDDYDFEEEN